MKRDSEIYLEAVGDISSGDVIPPEVLDLVRFMCATWDELDRWAYNNCNGEVLAHYPVIQGITNQLRLKRIGAQTHNTVNVGKAVEWMLRESK